MLQKRLEHLNEHMDNVFIEMGSPNNLPEEVTEDLARDNPFYKKVQRIAAQLDRNRFFFNFFDFNQIRRPDQMKEHAVAEFCQACDDLVVQAALYGDDDILGR